MRMRRSGSMLRERRCQMRVARKAGEHRNRGDIVSEFANNHIVRRLSRWWRVSIVKATSKVQVKNDRVTVTEWCFAPGADTGHHVHAYDYVVVPVTSGTLRLEEPTGPREVHLEAGASYARPAGIAHNVINANPYEFRFVEIELTEPVLDLP